jgi:peptide-methionine (S)-S-oxide reductase
MSDSLPRVLVALLVTFGLALAIHVGIEAAQAGPMKDATSEKPSSAKVFTPKPSASGKVEVATFAGGCFWGFQEKFNRIDGVLFTTVGYTGGHTKNPTYKDVCTRKTGHAEAVKVEFDPAAVSYAQLVEKFWTFHDPTQKNRQGFDIGDNYRTAIFYHSPEQKRIAEASMAKANTEGGFGGAIVTELTEAKEFYKAEEYHQFYMQKTGTAFFCQ